MVNENLQPCLCGFRPLSPFTLRKHRKICPVWQKRDRRTDMQREFDELRPVLEPMFKNWIVTLPGKDPTLQDIISIQPKPGTKRVVLTLACGHQVTRQGVPQRTKMCCPKCRSQRET
jgi:hypothetical protein